jgi:glycosyltransferase involved in cell wall biosynthesis
VRIAQVAPLAEAVPPKLYGGTERVVSWLTEELVYQGHDVTLFASGDSQTSAELIACVPQGLRLAGIQDHLASLLVMLSTVRRRSDEFDVIHFHIDLLQYPLFHDIAFKSPTTLHGRLDLPDYHPVYQAFPGMPLISISQDQRKPMPAHVNWLANVYHGLPARSYSKGAGAGGYLAFLGRIAPEKRPDRAIQIAKRAGVPLKLAAKVDPVDEAYFAETIKPLLAHPLIEFVGEIKDEEKGAFLGDALALLFPIDWPEPFGLVMIESLANGTPVIAWLRGSASEVIEDGVSGVLVDCMEDAVRAVDTVRSMSRELVRARFEARFTSTRMASDYIAAYKRLASGTAPKRSTITAAA